MLLNYNGLSFKGQCGRSPLNVQRIIQASIASARGTRAAFDRYTGFAPKQIERVTKWGARTMVVNQFGRDFGGGRRMARTQGDRPEKRCTLPQ